MGKGGQGKRERGGGRGRGRGGGRRGLRWVLSSDRIEDNRPAATTSRESVWEAVISLTNFKILRHKITSGRESLLEQDKIAQAIGPVLSLNRESFLDSFDNLLDPGTRDSMLIGLPPSPSTSSLPPSPSPSSSLSSSLFPSSPSSLSSSSSSSSSFSSFPSSSSSLFSPSSSSSSSPLLPLLLLLLSFLLPFLLPLLPREGGDFEREILVWGMWGGRGGKGISVSFCISSVFF